MRARCFVLGLVACLAGCNDSKSPAIATPTTPTPVAEVPVNPTTAMVQGVILDFQTARPMPGAVVVFATDSSLTAGTGDTTVADANGHYTLPEPPLQANGRPAMRYFFVNERLVGSGYPRAVNYRADLAFDQGRCIARYGMVLDRSTLRPVAGAVAKSLSNQVRATSGSDGWYHIDFGCGVDSIGFNTTWHVMEHPDYQQAQFLSGRGISGNRREDVLLVPK